MKLLTQSSAKLDKSQTGEWLNAILYLEPSVDFGALCPSSTKGCRASCLVHSGRMRMKPVVDARKLRTNLFLNAPTAFKAMLHDEINALLRRATKQDKRLAIRLNGTSDIDWTDVYEAFPDVQFYEYTKRYELASTLLSLPNVEVTVSRTEDTTGERIRNLALFGINVAVVFDDKSQLPETYEGVPVINGDKHDRRFEDDKGVIVGLKLKGTNKVKQLARDCGFAVTGGEYENTTI